VEKRREPLPAVRNRILTTKNLPAAKPQLSTRAKVAKETQVRGDREFASVSC
jgi:hypothetical protein